MVEKDFIVRDLIIKYDGLFNINDIYKNLKTLLKKNLNYELLNEKTYDEKRYNGFKDTKIKLESTKKINDYIKFIITTTLKTTDCKDVIVQNKHLQKGNIKIEFEASIESDYKEKWSGKSIYAKFFRDIYDKYIMEYQHNRLARELKEETYTIYNELKESLK